MRAERGHAEGTIGNNLRSATEFLDGLVASGKRLESVRITDIDAAIEAKTARVHCSRVTIRGYAERLRAFVRFAEGRGWCTPGMAEGVVPGRFYPGQEVRSTLSRADIQRLLATTDGGRPLDRRDRAILMLLIVYGLRAGEVRTLQLDDLDWENETLRVHRPKTGRTDLFPLSQAVGQAIVRYLVNVRPPRPERALFLTLWAPIRPLGRSAPGRMVRRRMDEAGIAAERRGTHTLRHTAAQHLLDPEARRLAGRKRSRRRAETRRAAGLCIRCGHLPPEDGRAMCEPCREERRAGKRALHAERRAAGLCVQCATPPPGGKAYCDPCAKIRRQACPLCRSAGQGQVCRVQCALAGGRPLRALFAQAPGELGRVPGHPDLGSRLDGDRDRHGPGSRHL